MSGTVLTNKGLALITKLVAASTELQISRVAVGTGRVPSGVDPQTMVDLNEYKMDAQIESYGVSPDQSDVAYIAAQVSSIGVSAGFAVTEAGVFATDPDVGEILYAYLDLTEDPQYIYAETDAISKFAEITFNVLIGSVAKVTAYVSPGALTKKVDFNAFKESIETPEFDDSGTVEGISSFPSFLEAMKSKMNFFQFFRNLKAGLQFVLHAGQIVNNCVTDNAGLPLSAAQGKVLKDLYTQLYSDSQVLANNLSRRLLVGNDIASADLLNDNPAERFGTLSMRFSDGTINQLLLLKDTAAVTILRNNVWAEQYRFATTTSQEKAISNAIANLQEKTTLQEKYMTSETQTLTSNSATLENSEITIPFDCIMIGNWKVLCKSSDANASFYYMVNNAYVQGRAQWDGTVQTNNTVNIFVMNRFTKGQKLSVSVQGNCSVRGNNTSLTRYTFTFIPV